MAKKTTKAAKSGPAAPPPRGVIAYADPPAFQAAAGVLPKGSVALGLDLGLRTGFAYAISDGRQWNVNPEYIGFWDISSGRYDSGSLAFLKLYKFLDTVQPVFCSYELVRFTPTEAITRYNAGRVLARCATSAELLGALRQTVLFWAETHGAVCVGYPIQTLKKAATGKGNANKPEMVAACNARFGTEFGTEDCETTGADDAADAAFALHCGLTEFGSQLLEIKANGFQLPGTATEGHPDAAA